MNKRLIGYKHQQQQITNNNDIIESVLPCNTYVLVYIRMYDGDVWCLGKCRYLMFNVYIYIYDIYLYLYIYTHIYLSVCMYINIGKCIFILDSF